MHDFIYRAIWLQVVLLAIGVPALFVVFLAGRGQPGAGEEQPFNGLLRKKSRIRSIAQIGRLGQVDAIKALQPYWNSKDADERYFSLYYSASCAYGPELREPLCLAILAAPFRGARKTEMLRALHLSNAELQDHADRASGTQRADIIRSLNGEQMTADELKRLFQLQETDPTIRCAAIPCLTACPLEQAVSYIRKGAVSDADPVLRGLIAVRLADRNEADARQLLSLMLEDPVLSVRESAMESMAAHGEEGALLMLQMAGGASSPKQKLARRYVSLKGL